MARNILLSYRQTPATETGKPQGWELDRTYYDGASPQVLVVKEQSVPGMFNYPDLHITHLRGEVSIDGEACRMLIVCATEGEPLEPRQRDHLLHEGRTFAKAQLEGKKETSNA